MFFDLNSKINPQKPFAQKEIVKSSIEGRVILIIIEILFIKMDIVV